MTDAVFVVLKQPVDLEGACEIVGAFTTVERASQACNGAGTYIVARCKIDRIYKQGTLLDVARIVVTT
jgi:hypothetical protein